MTAFTIPGLTVDLIRNTDTTPSVARLKPFPCSYDSFTRYTGRVTGVSLKQIGDSENFSVTVENNGHQAEILVRTDPQQTNPKSKLTTADQVQKNLTLLAKLVATLGIVNARGQIDEALFDKAVGKLVTFDAKNKLSKDGKYTNTQGFFVGSANELDPVEPVTVETRASQSTGTDDGIPF